MRVHWTFYLTISLLFWMAGCNPSDAVGHKQAHVGAHIKEYPGIPLFGVQPLALTAEEGFSQVLELNATWVRRDGPLWSELEPVEGQIDWSVAEEKEQELSAAASAGLEVILVIRGTPAWAQHPEAAGYICGPINPSKLESFRDFIVKYVSRYSARPFNVRYYEFWNEPDIEPNSVNRNSGFGCWGNSAQDGFGGRYYGEMLAQIYPAVKRAHSDAQVLIGGLLLDCDPRNPPEISPGSGQAKDCRSAQFIEGILEAGGGDYFDGISFHAYDYYYQQEGLYGNPNWHSDSANRGPSMVPKIDYLRELLEKYGVADKYLINSEQALLCGQRGDEDFCKTEAFQTSKAAYLIHSYTTALSQNLLANIWYSLRGWRASGLVNNEFSPEPAYQSFRFASALLGQATYVGIITDYPEVTAHAFQKNGLRIWVLWAPNGAQHQIELPGLPARLHDMYGETLEPAKVISTDFRPIYVLWEMD